MRTLRYISRQLLPVRDAASACVFLHGVARFICEISHNFSYYLSEKTHI